VEWRPADEERDDDSHCNQNNTLNGDYFLKQR
jgi:hypothetical protein